MISLEGARGGGFFFRKKSLPRKTPFASQSKNTGWPVFWDS